MSYPTQAIAEALLDLHHIDTSAAEGDEGNEAVMQSVTARLSELSAFSGTFDDEADELTLDVTPMLVAIATTQRFLTRQLAQERGISPEAVRFEVREYLSEIAAD